MSEGFRWSGASAGRRGDNRGWGPLRALPPELRMLLALLLILAGSWLVSQLAGGSGFRVGGSGFRSLWPTLKWPVGIGAGLALVTGVGWFLHARRQRRFRRELELTTAGPTRREEAEREREYKRKWLRGVEQLKASGKSLYDLPWYVIIGEPAGGKTMTLVNSGMDFPLGKEELPGFGGTRNYNWWFTNDAVILDTAGRLVFEQEGTTDKKEWEEFLRTLRNRRRCPINGVVVGLPADKLMKDSREQRAQAATILRDRLRQMQAVLGVRFPVYLLITKMDLVAGFTEFFDHCDALQRNQIFGWSRPGAFETGYDAQEFPRDFGEVRRRLDDLRVRFLAGAARPTAAGSLADVPTERAWDDFSTASGTPTVRRGGVSDEGSSWIFTFPEAFMALQERLQDYVDVIFSRNVFAEPLFFRGFYFTSALQEGKPILELLGTRLAKEDLRDLKDLFPQSRAYFIYDFYTKKVAAEQGLVFRSAKQIQRSRLLRRLTYQVMLPALVVMLAVFALGFMQLRHRMSKPKVDALRARDMIAQVRGESAATDLAPVLTDKMRRDASNLLDELAVDEEVLRGGWLSAMLLFDDAGSMIADLANIRRELFGHTLLVSKVRQIETALVDESLSLKNEERFSDFRAALLEYLKCSSRQIALQPSFETMMKILEPSERDDRVFVRHLEAFEADGDARRAFRSWSLAPGAARDAPRPSAAAGTALGQGQIVGTALQRVDANARLRVDDLLSRGDDPWSEVAAKAAEVMNRYRDILAAARKFADASTDELRAAAVGGWDRACGGEGACGTVLFEPVLAALRKVPTTERPPNQELDAFASQIKRFWQDVEGIVNAASDVPVRAELAGRVQQLVAGFGRFMEEKKRQSSNQLGTYAFMFSSASGLGLALSDGARQVITALDSLSGMIHPRQSTSGETGDRLQIWIAAIGALSGGSPGSAEPCALPGLVPEWSGVDLEAACTAVTARRQRQACAETLQSMLEALSSSPAPPLSRFVRGADDTEPRIPGVRAGSTRPFLLRVAEQKATLIAAIEGLSAAAGGENGVDPVPVKTALERSMAAYVQQYVDDWAQVYNTHKLPELERLWKLPNARWRDFRRFIVGADEARREERLAGIWQAYVAQQQILQENLTDLLPPAAAGSASAQEVARLLSQIKPTDNAGPFAPWYGARLEGRPLPDLSAGEKAWLAFAEAATSLHEQLDEHDFAALTDPLPNMLGKLALSASGSEDFLAQQLQWVIDMAEALLNAEINERIQKKRNPLSENRTFFPFTGGAPSEDLKFLRALLTELSVMAPFAEKLGPRSVVRDQFFKQAAAWLEFLKHEGLRIRISCRVSDGAAVKELNKNPLRLVFHCPGLQDELDRMNLNWADEKYLTPSPVGGDRGGKPELLADELEVTWKPQSNFYIKFGDQVLPGGSGQKDSAFLWFLREQCQAGSDAGGDTYYRKTWPSVRVGRYEPTLTMEFQLSSIDRAVPLVLPEAITSGDFGVVQRPRPPWEKVGK